MFKQNEQIKLDTQKAIDTAMELVTASIHSVEKLTHIQLETSRQIMEETSKAVKDLSSVTDPKELISRVNEIAAQTVEKNLASARDVYDVVSEVKSKLNQVTEENIQNLQQAALNSVDEVAKYNPSGAQATSESLKTWINGTNQAMAAMNKAVSQVSEFTTSNLSAAAVATMNAVKKNQVK